MLITWKISDVNKKDILEYEKLIQSSNGKATKFSLSHLYRKNVVKEIWWGENLPLYLRIECARSELVAAQGKENFGAVEKMEDVKSVYQEKLFYQLPDGRKGFLNHEGKVVVKEGENEIVVDTKTVFPMQDVRYFEALKGTCGYKNLDFIGENVKMKKFRLRGHISPPFMALTQNPLSSGEGQKMHFYLKEKGIELRLDGLKTTFNPKEGV